MTEIGLAEIVAGSAEVVITPPLGVSMAGYFHDRRADDVGDDLYAKALVLQSADTRAAVVVCDLLWLAREDIDEIRAGIEDATGITAEHVQVACTHTHTGPATTAWGGLGILPDEAYMEVLKRRIVDAVRLAYGRIGPATVRAGSGHVDGIAFNRRYRMADGTVRTNPPMGSPNIDRRAGPIDPELGILLVADTAGTARVLLSSYALHPDQVGGTALSADYEGAESRLLKQVFGSDCVVLCPNGCCGDINHVDFLQKGRLPKGASAARRSGAALAGEIVRAHVGLAAPRLTPLRVGRQMVTASLRVPSDDEIAWAREKAKQDMVGFDDHGLQVVAAHRINEIHESGRRCVDLEVSAIGMGDVALVGLPGEVFVELGLAIKARSPFAHTFVHELCNAAVGYIPTAAAYDEGGYEATTSKVVPGTGEALVEAAVDLLSDLYETA